MPWQGRVRNCDSAQRSPVRSTESWAARAGLRHAVHRVRGLYPACARAHRTAPPTDGGSGIGNTTAGTLAFGTAEARVYAVNSFNIGSAITGTGGLTKGGGGTLTLTNAANSFSGGQGITINGGTISIAADAALGNAANVVRLNNGGTLQTSATFSTARNFTLGQAGGGVSVNSSVILTLNGTISGGLGNVTAGIGDANGLPASTSAVLTKSGSGTLILTGANTYTGNTTITAGTLRANADSALGAVTGGVTISGNAVLQAGATFSTNRPVTLGSGGGTIDTNGSSLTLGATSAVSGSTLTKIGSGTLAINGAQTYTRLNANAGTTIVNTPLGSGSATVSASANVTFGASQKLASLTIGAGAVVTLAAQAPGAPLGIAPSDSAMLPTATDGEMNLGTGPLAVGYEDLPDIDLLAGTSSGSSLNTDDPNIGGSATSGAFNLQDANFGSSIFDPQDVQNSAQAVPEPNAIALLSLAALALFRRRAATR